MVSSLFRGVIYTETTAAATVRVTRCFQNFVIVSSVTWTSVYECYNITNDLQNDTANCCHYYIESALGKVAVHIGKVTVYF